MVVIHRWGLSWIDCFSEPPATVATIQLGETLAEQQCDTYMEHTDDASDLMVSVSSIIVRPIVRDTRVRCFVLFRPYQNSPNEHFAFR